MRLWGKFLNHALNASNGMAKNIILRVMSKMKLLLYFSPSKEVLSPVIEISSFQTFVLFKYISHILWVKLCCLYALYVKHKEQLDTGMSHT